MSKVKWLIAVIALGLIPLSKNISSTGIQQICAIQGNGKTTPYAGQQVQTEGVVTADFDDRSERGFFIQLENCDASTETSDGIFVYLNEMNNVVSVGDWVTVVGIAEEDFGLTRINTTPAEVSVVSSDNLLPQAADFSPPFDNPQAKDYFEARESMRVGAADTVVVGPTDAHGNTYVVRAGLGLNRVFEGDPMGTGEIIPISSAGIYQIEPDAQVGDQISSVVGVVNFTGGEFGILLTSFPTLIRPGTVDINVFSHSQSGGASTSNFTIATLNLHNLFDPIDDPYTDDPIIPPSEYQRKLKKLALTIHDGLGEPLLIAVQEAENAAVLQALINRPEILMQYAYVWEDGPDKRGIDVALLYQSERVAILSSKYHQGCATLVDGLGPDGNGDVLNPVNTLTCDTDGDIVNDGNRLFSRPPLVSHVQVCETICGNGATRERWVIAVHFKSKFEDTDLIEYTLPRRILQAQFVTDLYAEILDSSPGAEVIILGDFNDYPNSQPLQTVQNAGLINQSIRLFSANTYTYIFQGVSQIIDHILVSPALTNYSNEGLFPQIAHLNADYPVSWEGDDALPRRATDHDPVMIHIISLPNSVWLPVAMHP